ncbi:MAG: hypothetical protein MI922_16705, partial [Bacteroidales bacterium]|nr:hypothetical protein [Bacteroidales bacterium]
GWWLYADMYSPKKQFHKAYKSGWKDVNGTNTRVTNRSNSQKTCPWGHVTHTKSLSESVSFTVESTAGLSWDFGINVEVFKMDVTSNISLKLGKTTNKTATETVTHNSDAFKMKPKTAYQIKLQYKTAKQKITHKYPVTLTGKVGFNYKKKVQMSGNSEWHFWWGIPSSKIFKGKTHEVRVVSHENYVDEYRWSIKEYAKVIEM